MKQGITMLDQMKAKYPVKRTIPRSDLIGCMEFKEFMWFVETVSGDVISNSRLREIFARLYADKRLIVGCTGRMAKTNETTYIMYRRMTSKLRYCALRNVMVKVCTLLNMEVPDYLIGDMPDGIVEHKRSSETDSSVAIPKSSWTLSREEVAASHLELSVNARIQEQKANDYMHRCMLQSPHKEVKIDVRKAEELYGSCVGLDLSKLEARISEGYRSDLSGCDFNLLKSLTAACTGIPPSRLFGTNHFNSTLLEKPMQNLKVTRPVLVGNVNILTAKDFELAAIVREAQQQIESNADMAKLSEHYKAKNEELNTVIALCVEQLDKDKENQAK